MICPGGNLRERMVGGRPRDFGDVGYLGVLLNIQVSDRTFSEQMQACENHSTYVPATTLGMLLQACCLRADNDKGESPGTGPAKLKAAIWANPATSARRQATISLWAQKHKAL